MNLVTLTDIPFKIDVPALLNQLHMRPDNDDIAEVLQLVSEAESVGRPKAMYQLSSVVVSDERRVAVDGITFASRILRVNLEEVRRVFPYMATCGIELQRWSETFHDMLVQYWVDVIKAMALTCATTALQQDLQMRYQPGPTATMNPGSLQDWPLSEQKPFFKLYGDHANAIGVTLSDSCLMTPNKSVTGFQFSSERNYENCQLCPREECPGRRAPYDYTLYDLYGLNPARS